jgi:hypothetical protein
MAIRSYARRLLVVGVLSLAGASSAQAQYYPRVGFPGYGGVGGFGAGVIAPFAGPGGYQAGTAQLVQAQGQVLLDQEQARVDRQKAYQAKIDTQRKSFDEMAYEKANTASYGEQVALMKNQTINRILRDPAEAEINRGDTLNLLMPFIASLATKGIQGPPLPIYGDTLNHVNVSVGKGGKNIGVLKGYKEADWPLGLQGPLQEKLSPMVTTVIDQASSGKLDAKTYKKLISGLDELREELRKKYHTDQIEGSDFLAGKHYIDDMQNAVRALAQPGTKQLLVGTQRARGNNVPELVSSMLTQGLSFAPANPGDEAAYHSLHNAFAAYVSTAQASSGFQLQLRPDLPTMTSQKQ